MNKNEYIKENFGVDSDVLGIVDSSEEKISDMFKDVDETAHINQLKVMKAFSDNRVSESCFASTTGYGYDDVGREVLDKVYAQSFGAEDALVRHNFISGTHAITTVLYGILRPGDLLVSVTGSPYDTLEEAIGTSGESELGSLADFGVEYSQVDLSDSGLVNFKEVQNLLSRRNPKAVLIQRSKGYGWRPTFSSKYIGEIVKFIKDISNDIICIVDNCYGEFVETSEPTDFGADIIVGSLIKNPGGGLAVTGGYIAGRRQYVELASYRLTSVGIGRECGASLGFNRLMFQGLFMAPHTVAQAVKAALLCSSVYDSLGFEVMPSPFEKRADIIQSIKFENPDKVIAFCQGIQKGAPVDSFVTPEPWDMPGYQSKVIMAAGAFVQGASIELSADAPMREPYIAYMQGGLTYESARIGIIMSVQAMRNKGLL